MCQKRQIRGFSISKGSLKRLLKVLRITQKFKKWVSGDSIFYKPILDLMFTSVATTRLALLYKKTPIFLF